MKTETRELAAALRYAKLIRYSTPPEKALSVAAMTTGLSIARVREIVAEREGAK